ncbi:unnamed protein product, partial [Rotaria sp. Silwood1]
MTTGSNIQFIVYSSVTYQIRVVLKADDNRWRYCAYCLFFCYMLNDIPMINQLNGAVVLFIVYCFVLCPNDIQRRCRCIANDSTCWPNSTVWQGFNQSIDGRLVIPQSSAAVCSSTQFNAYMCALAKTQWTNSSWRIDQVGAMQSYNWENTSCSIFIENSTCDQGAVPVLAVNATLPEHVQTTIQFVQRYNLRLVIKTSGHDFLGRSRAYGALLLWVHYMKNMTLIDLYTGCGNVVSNAIRLSAGVEWGEVYSWLNEHNLTAIGGSSGTVGSVGGYSQGGGHSILSRWKGLSTDNILEFDVVTADGQRQTANACQNKDLFWALAGGGGDTFAVVLNAVLRTYPSPPLIVFLWYISPLNGTRYDNFIRDVVKFLPTLADGNWSGYFSFYDTSASLAFICPYGDMNVANVTVSGFIQNNTDLDLTKKVLFSSPSFYPFFNTVLEPNNPTGDNVLLGSRLIPEAIVRNQSDDVAQAFIDVRNNRINQGQLIGHLIAGGQVSKINNDTSVNPVWRTSLIHIIYGTGWPDLTSQADQQVIAKHVTSQVQILQKVAGGNQSGCYMNEADPNEPNWQQKFFGTQANYDRLKTIKNAVDPLGLFI